MTKRPWTEGPWEDLFELLFSDYNQVPLQEQKANQKLASKSPEFAELCIEFIKEWEFSNHLDAPALCNKYTERAEKLLAEVGYTEQERED